MKKTISILLILAFLICAAAVSAHAWTSEENPKAGDEATVTPPPPETLTRRYYFQMPNGHNGPVAAEPVPYWEYDPETGKYNNITVERTPSWYHQYARCATIFWWDGSLQPDAWPGYDGVKADDAPDIYYADVPIDVTKIIWSNGFSEDPEKTYEPYLMHFQTRELNVEDRVPGEEPGFPDGIPEDVGFHNKIYIINAPDEQSFTDELTGSTYPDGRWYFYYGAGCYGLTDNSGAAVNADECCLNPDHRDKDGNHVIPELVTFIRGDADNDGDISVLDATAIRRRLAKLPNAAFLEEAADTDRDGLITVLDATHIQRYLAKLSDIGGADYTG